MIEIRNTDFDLGKIAASGQCFRLTKLSEDEYLLIAGDRLLRLRALPDGAAFLCGEEEYSTLWAPYFDLAGDYLTPRTAIPAKDAFLSAAVTYGQGIRILRQSPWEMLITFIISQRKNIPAIQKSVEALCRCCGTPLPDGDAIRYAFPTPRQLAALSPEALAACSLGYRARYLKAAAELVNSGTINLTALGNLPDDSLREELMKFPGVGVKVANCVLLFGYHRLCGFPRDVWINRIIDTVYGGDFPLEPYAGFEGIIQQYIFYYARSPECRQKYGF